MRQNVNWATGRAGGSSARFVRALVVFSSLASLCVSDGTGPRLIPIPFHPSLGQAAQAAQAARADAAGEGDRAPVRAEPCAASGPQPKAVTPVWNNASLGRAALSPPAARPGLRPDLYTSPGYSFRSSSSTRGRAPPQKLPTA